MNGFYIPVVDVTDVQTVWTRLVLSFVHSLWIGAIVGVLALAAFWLLRAGNRRNARYLMLVSALLATAASPVLVFVALAPETALMMFDSPDNRPPVEVPGRLILTRPLVDPAAQPPPPEDTAAEPIRLVDYDEKVYVVPEVVGPPYAGTGFTPVTREGGPANWRIAISSKVIVAIYLLIAGALMARLAIGIAGGTRLRRTSQLVTDGALLSALARHTQALGMRITPAIAHCARVAVPTVVGVVRPMILLPLSATTGMTPEQIEYLVLHELAHIRRYDHIVNLIQRLIEALMFYHPVVWLLSRQIRIEREHCCDDMVVRLGGDARHYAESLLAAAALAQGQRAPSAVPTLGATGKASHLRRRIARILGEPAAAVRLRHAGWLFVTLALLVGIAGITQLRAGETTSESAVVPALTPPRNARVPVSTDVKIEPAAEAIPEAVTAPEARSEAPPTPERIDPVHPVVPPPGTTGQPRFPAAVPEAIGQLEDKDWWLRKLAIQQLVDSGWKDAWTFIVPLLNDEDKRVQAAAAIALGALKEPKSIKHLVAALKEGTEVSDASAKALAHFDPAQVMPLVRLAAQDEDNGVRRGAVKALREVKSPEALDVLYDLLRNDLIPDPKAQLKAALALADKKDPRAAEFLNKLRGNKSTRIDSERALSEMEEKAPEKPESSAQPTPEADPAAETSHSEHFLQFRLVLDDADAEGKPRYPAPSKEDPDGTVALADEVWLSEDDIADAIARANNDTGQPEIAFTIEPEAGKKFYELTKDSKGKKMAIVFNGTVLSAPTISDGISTSGVITGSFTMDEAEKIAAAINDAATSGTRG